jgi:hypothetical protein
VVQEFRPTQSFLESLARDVAPMIERIVGSRFRTLPTVRPAAPDEIFEYLCEELHPHTLIGFDVPDDDSARAYTERAARSVTENTLAKYRGKTNLVVVQPEVFQIQAKIFDRPDYIEADSVKLLLAHELVHALDDQDFQSSKRCMQPKSRDQTQVWTGVMEGHAQFVAARVAEELGLSELFLFQESIIAKPPPDLSEAEQFRHEWLHRYMSSAYLDGRQFFEHHVPRIQGFRKLVFGSLPASKRMILHPELYPGGVSLRPKLDLKKLWGGLREEDEDGWVSAVVEWDDFDLRCLTRRYLPTLDDAFFDELRNAELLICNDGVNVFGEEVLCSIWEGPSVDWATKAMNAFLKISRIKDDRWRRGEGRILSHRYSKETVNGFDEAWHVEKQHSSGSISVPLHYAFLRLGRFCVWVTMNGEPVEEASIRGALEEVASYLKEDVA